MKLQICAKCKKRPAMVFITRLEKDKSINEGLCLVCAHELGIRPVNDMLAKMGIDENEIENMIEGLDAGLPDIISETETPDGKVPTLNLNELFNLGNRVRVDGMYRFY